MNWQLQPTRSIKKEPILLLSRHFTQLVIQDADEAVDHNGVRDILNYIRERFWILRGPETVKQLIKECVICKKVLGKRSSAAPETPQLPAESVTDVSLFACTGIDFAGPLYIKSDSNPLAACNQAYVCASSIIARAVHLELVPGLSVLIFLQSFLCFVNHRDLPPELISDNAETFKSNTEQIAKLVRSRKFSMTLPTRVSVGILLWKEHLGTGNFEKMFHSVKTIRRPSFMFDELRMSLVEVEATLNNRLLTYMYDVSYPLTPFNLIYSCRISMIETTIIGKIVSMTSRKSLGIQLRIKRIHQGTNFCWRHCHPESSPRLFWRIARVEKLLPGRDNVVRSAIIGMLSGDNKQTVLLRRPIKQ